jgi:prevent-host-death family protein
MGKIMTRGAEEARNQLPQLLDAAAAGRTTLITRRGEAVAAIIPAEELQTHSRQRSLYDLRGTGNGLWGARSKQTIAKLKEEWGR